MAFRDITTGIVEAGDALHPYTANEDVKRGQLVEVGGEDVGVRPVDTDGSAGIGFATQTVSSGDQVTVAVVGCEVLGTSGTGAISRGDLVTSHGSTGEEGELATTASGDEVIGIALEADAGTNDDVRVLVTGPSGEVN
jgi:hypothetical protein